MTKFLLPILALSILLTGCKTPDPVTYIPLLDNPLYAERYSEELVNSMVNLEIYESEILEDETKSGYADKARNEWLAIAREARADQREGMQGNFITDDEFVQGEVLYHDDQLHFGTGFDSVPGGPSVHVYLTTSVDPRVIEFPEETSLDLGILFTAYGAQSYNVPPVEDPLQYRTAVLFDTKLERLIGFAQLNIPLNILNK
jgi:hypothetical protein